MTTAYSNALAEAFRLPGHGEAVDRIKQAVINEIRATDDRISIKKTEYFNHSFVPDLVLDWPQENERRIMFLRPDPNPGYIQEDIERSEDRNSIFYCLSEFGEQNRVTSLSLHENSRNTQTLVTDPVGLSELVTQKRRDPVARLASSAVLQGARGLLDRQRALSVTNAVTQGIEAASRTDSESTGGAVTIIEDSFDSTRASRLNRLLQAVWVGSGGAASSFPGSLDFANGLDEEALSYLLNLGTIGDFSFWRRLGRNLTLEKITNLRLDQFSENFQMLVNANVDVLDARTCRVVDAQPTLSEEQPAEDRVFKWKIENGNLALCNNYVAAHVSERADRLQAPESEEYGISFKLFGGRAAYDSIKVNELTLAAGGRTVSYSSEGAINVSRDERLTAVSKALGKEVVVQRAVALIPGRSPLTCDFISRTTSGKTRAVYSIMEIIRLSLALLTGMHQAEREQIRSIELNAREEPTLFD